MTERERRPECKENKTHRHVNRSIESARHDRERGDLNVKKTRHTGK